jgi:hypothetical protein
MTKFANRATLVLTLVVGVCALAACDPALETGYVPRRLKASESERRAFYAPQYTPEAETKEGPNLSPNLGGLHR